MNKVLDNTLSTPSLDFSKLGFYFLFLCLDHRHKQKHLAQLLDHHVPHDNKL